MPEIDILEEIEMNFDNCTDLLKRFKEANLSEEDIKTAKTEAGATPLHFIMWSCMGDGVLDLIKYMVKLDPESVEAKAKNTGFLPIHMMPDARTSFQQDQLEARQFLMEKYPEGLKIKSNKGRTPLNEAIFRNCHMIVKQVKDFQMDDTIKKGRLKVKKKEASKLEQENKQLRADFDRTKEEQSATKALLARSNIRTSKLADELTKTEQERDQYKNLLAQEKGKTAQVELRCHQEIRMAEVKLLPRVHNMRRTIEILNERLLELEERLATTENTNTRPLEPSSFEASRKRARVSISANR